jgi:hypothetical protein
MPHYKETNKEQGQFIPVIFEEQILAGTRNCQMLWIEKYP